MNEPSRSASQRLSAQNLPSQPLLIQKGTEDFTSSALDPIGLAT